MKKFILTTALLTVGCVVLSACNISINTGKTTSLTEETPATSEATTEATAASSDTSASDTSETAAVHKIEVADLSRVTLSDDYDEYVTKVPKLIVDGEEATAINMEMNNYILKNYTIEMDNVEKRVMGDVVDYVWGHQGNIVSIILKISNVNEDGTRYDFFNYNVDTLERVSNDEILAAFGMDSATMKTKLADAYKAWWDSEEWLKEFKNDLQKSIDNIKDDNVTVFICPEGHISAAGTIYTSGAQIPESTKCFDLETNTVEYFN